MPAASAAERQRRYRERRKAASDLVRTFLEGVVEDATTAVKDGNCPPWLLARSASAIDALEDLGEVESDRSPILLNLVCVAAGAHTEEERARAIEEHERDFRRWLMRRDPTRTKTLSATTKRVEMSVTILQWANGERIAGRSTAASLTQGLNAAKRLIRARGRAGTAEEFEEFTAPTQVRGLSIIVSGGRP